MFGGNGQFWLKRHTEVKAPGTVLCPGLGVSYTPCLPELFVKIVMYAIYIFLYIFHN